MQTTSATAPVRIVSTTSPLALPYKAEQQDEQTIADFAADLDAAVRDLEVAVVARDKVGKKVHELNQTLADQGWWSTIKANFSGKTDKELATMVEDLGASLGLTQSALRVILKVQTEKNRLLRGFSQALVEKISKIQIDAHTLDGNQKKASLNFLQELQTQIDEQIQQQELVESHEAALQDHAQWRQGQERAGAHLVSQIEQMKAAALRNQQRLATLEAEVAVIPALGQRVAALENENRRSRTPKAVMWRNLLPACALLMGIVALFVAMRA